ncbi:hypothetical protein [Legionella worsleiensis]|uniref:SidC N-terminal domain-containing protein n=1 Tax=Legionella worsleiensis TaxID=45076 RepID=A0A0W1AJL9_9GAMM|nr:hypothetical protein [Legionella worsleiensis]KTD81424.1 hypothetical protein Lwor_0701 [Legionella worsleiensis]STY30114.1 SidC homolog [Legionella worsleiensis]
MAATETTVKSLIDVSKTLQEKVFSVLLKNKGFFNKHDVATLRPLKKFLTNTLIEYVAHGRQDEAKAILDQFPELLLERGSANDIAGNLWEGTAFQYAVWAMDTHMYTMMLDCLPQNEQGVEIRKGLLEQAKAQKEHFNFQPLITALQTYVNNFNVWDESQREEHLCKVVGMAQRDLPAHVRHEYCNPNRSFKPVPSFNEQVFLRSLGLYNWPSSTSVNWDGGLLGLGSYFARMAPVMDGVCLTVCAEDAISLDGPPQQDDLASITALCEVRTKDLIALMQRLQSPIQKPEDVSQAPTSMIS